MGRKIPAKKHRGVKDPLVQQARRLQSLKGKINAPPRDPDDQPVPKSLLRLFAPPRPAKESRAPRSTGGGGHGPPQALQRLPGEGAKAFSRRITESTRALIAADDMQDYPVEEAEDEHMQRHKRRRRGHEADPDRPDKRQRQKEKQRAKKQEKLQQNEQEALSRPRYDYVPFGEQAHAPPSLSLPRLPEAVRDRNKHLATPTPKPGRRPLLLSAMLTGSNAANTKAGAHPTPSLSAADREAARLSVVAAYRQLKAAKRTAAAPE